MRPTSDTPTSKRTAAIGEPRSDCRDANAISSSVGLLCVIDGHPNREQKVAELIGFRADQAFERSAKHGSSCDIHLRRGTMFLREVFGDAKRWAVSANMAAPTISR